MRAVAGLLIVCAAVLLAIRHCGKINERCSALDELCIMLICICGEIRCFRAPLEDIIRKVSRFDFARRCSEQLEQGADFKTAWQCCARMLAGNGTLTREQSDSLCSLGFQLGRGDAQEQLTLIENNLAFFRAQREQAHTQRTEKTRTATACYILGGVLIAVLIL